MPNLDQFAGSLANIRRQLSDMQDAFSAEVASAGEDDDTSQNEAFASQLADLTAGVDALSADVDSAINPDQNAPRAGTPAVHAVEQHGAIPGGMAETTATPAPDNDATAQRAAAGGDPTPASTVSKGAADTKEASGGRKS